MTAPAVATYTDRNQRALLAELDRVHAALVGTAPAAPAAHDETTRLGRLVALFGLSAFERDVLLWCAAGELEGRFATAFGAAHGDGAPQPTFGLALARLPGAHWDALSPNAPLRHWRLVELGAGSVLVNRPLHVDERVLHYLTGVDLLDPRLVGVVEVDDEPGRLAPAHRRDAEDLAALLDRLPRPATLALDGATPATLRRVVAHIAASLGRLPLVLRGSALGNADAAFARLVEREVALLGGLLHVDAGDDGAAADVFVGRLACPVVVGGNVRITTRTAPVRHTLPELGVEDRLAVWRDVLGPAALRYGAALPEAADQFRFDVAAVEAVCAEQDARGHEPARLLETCRGHGRGVLEDLAQHIPPRAGWDDLILPEPVLDAVRDIARQARHRALVYGEWGMAGPTGRGLGVTALFTGDSGTGKTLAAEVLAGALDLDLYRIDLASVVSKYIGETEKNLKRVFDAAETTGAVLLFDEADALFGKRSDVKDSHDRYANVEVAYLLQRMEAYRGLAILTTNLRTALDRAFLRRLRFVVSFPFPDEPLRAAIWARQLPPSVPTEGVDPARLARLRVPGGNIRSIALSAAFLAADSGGPLRMEHLLQAARREYAKLEKPLTDSEIRGWC